MSAVSRATSLDRPWAFTDRHAELAHALHFDDLGKLGEVPWSVMPKPYWSDVKEERQAEFLVEAFFPWTAVAEVVAMTAAVATRTTAAIQGSAHRPPVVVRREWSY